MEALKTASDYYKELYKKENTSSHSYFLNNLPQVSSNNNNILTSPITKKELIDIISKLPNNKAPGPDGISYEFYKEKQQLLLPFLLKTFNNILSNATIPSSWKTSSIILIPKKSNDKHLIKNWRPIALINADCKLFMKILANRLNKNILQKIISPH